jgi:excisionase family DNA binding protein
MENKRKIRTDSFLDVHEASRLLHINEKKIYTLAREGKLPGTKVTGKWLFPRRELEDLLHEQAAQTLKKFSLGYARRRRVLLIAGSDDPALYMAQGILHGKQPDYVLFSASLGSGEGLRLLHENYCHAALSHLYDEESNDYTFPFIEKLFEKPGELVVMNLFHRTVGFVSRDTPVRSFSEIADSKLRFINRQRQSGIRRRVDGMMKTEGLAPRQISGFDEEVYTHVDVASRVMSGAADVGVAAASAAPIPCLAFHPLFEERFDMVMRKSVFFEEAAQVFIEFVRSSAFTDLLGHMRGYDCSDTGRIVYPNHSYRRSD